MSYPEKLAEAVRDTRARRGNLTQADVAERGGPSTETMRRIEGAMQDSYGARTLFRLDRALGWPEGTARKILDGNATDDDVKAVRHEPTHDDHGQLRTVTMYQVLDGVERTMECPVGATATWERSGWRLAEDRDPAEDDRAGRYQRRRRPGHKSLRALAAAAEGGDEAAAAELAEFSEEIGRNIKAMTDTVSAGISEYFAAAPHVGAISKLAADLAAASNLWKAAAGIDRRATGGIAAAAAVASSTLAQAKWITNPTTIDLSAAIPKGLGFSNALALPMFHPDTIKAAQEMLSVYDEIEQRPWYDEEAPWTTMLARYRLEQKQQRDEDEADPGEGDEGDGTRRPDLRLVPSHDPAAEDLSEVLEPTEILPPTWSFMVAAHQDLGDVDTVTLASELFDRVRRMPPSVERDDRMRVVNGLIGELLQSDRRAAIESERPRSG